jgi:hypothetical protein
VDTCATSLDIGQFAEYWQKVIWAHGLIDAIVPVLGNITYYEELAQQFGGLERVRSGFDNPPIGMEPSMHVANERHSTVSSQARRAGRRASPATFRRRY